MWKLNGGNLKVLAIASKMFPKGVGEEIKFLLELGPVLTLKSVVL